MKYFYTARSKTAAERVKAACMRKKIDHFSIKHSDLVYIVTSKRVKLLKWLDVKEEKIK